MSGPPSSRSYRDLTPYQEVNELLQFYVQGIESRLRENLRGIYLTGSLSYGAFRYGSSDIDVMVIVERPLSGDELNAIHRLHAQMEESLPKWSRRLECSYTPVSMLSSVAPPNEPRPWYWGGEGVLYEDALYGNEWIINNYLLYQHGIALHGPAFRELTGPIDIKEVQRACIRDLFQEWEPKAGDVKYLQNSHYAAYFVLNICRIVYTVMQAEAGSKPVAAAWVRDHYGEPWSGLIRTAEGWHHGMDLDLRERAVQFLHFAIGEVTKTALYAQLAGEIRELRESRAR